MVNDDCDRLQASNQSIKIRRHFGGVSKQRVDPSAFSLVDEWPSINQRKVGEKTPGERPSGNTAVSPTGREHNGTSSPPLRNAVQTTSGTTKKCQVTRSHVAVLFLGLFRVVVVAGSVGLLIAEQRTVCFAALGLDHVEVTPGVVVVPCGSQESH